jgi:hypothetical protein
MKRIRYLLKPIPFHQYALAALVVWLLGMEGGLAQEATVASGGDASGSGGSSSYSVGQVLYHTNFGGSTSISEGVQQPYEISIVTGVDDNNDLNIGMTIFPNPTTGTVTLKINEQTDGLSYQLFDVAGKLLASKSISDNMSVVSMDGLARATYILRVFQNDSPLQSFQIIKN